MKINADARVLIYFGVFSCICISIVALFFKFFLKKFEFKLSKSRVYGILTGLNNKEIFALSIVSANYVLLTFLAMMTKELNAATVSAVVVMSIIPWLLLKKYMKLAISIIVNLISLFSLYILSFVHTYLSGETTDLFMRISIFFIVAFVFIYFTYNLLNDINDIARREDNKKEGASNGTKKSRKSNELPDTPKN